MLRVLLTKLNDDVLTSSSTCTYLFLQLKLFLHIQTPIFDNTPGKEIYYTLKIWYFFRFFFSAKQSQVKVMTSHKISGSYSKLLRNNFNWNFPWTKMTLRLNRVKYICAVIYLKLRCNCLEDQQIFAGTIVIEIRIYCKWGKVKQNRNQTTKIKTNLLTPHNELYSYLQNIKNIKEIK